MDDKQWIEEVTGGTVTRFDRTSSGRSRGTWLVDVQQSDGTVHELVMRKDMGEGPLAGTEINLERESTVYRALNDTNVLIPALRAATPEVLLVDRARGTEDITTLTDAADKVHLAESFIKALADLHNLDPSTLDLPGIGVPAKPEDQALVDLDLWTRIFDGHVKRPAPWVRYGLAWLRRNAPLSDERTVVCHGDVGPGNFMFEGNEVSALLDWEFAHLGDPMDDIAWLSIRGAHFMDFGDMSELMRLYVNLTGVKINPDRVRYYQVFVLVRMAICCLVALSNRAAGSMDASTYFNLLPALAVMVSPIMAERSGVDVDASPRSFDGTPSPDGEVIDALFSDLTTVLMPAITNAAAADRAGGMVALLMHLSAADRHGDLVAAEEVAELSALLGQDVASAAEGWQLLDDRIAAGDAPDDATLLGYFNRMAQRQIVLWPALAMMVGRPIAPVPAP
jgi:aminoglycoside phosphotransferase (APT) family kinase protein